NYYIAEAGVARTTAALGKIDDAIALYQHAIDAVPQPEYLAALGDLYALRGERARAESLYETVRVSATLASASLYDRQLALFYLAHARDLDDGLAIAHAALIRRPDVYGEDIEAWALYKAGRYSEARAASDRALALGTPDARFHYHAGLIALATDETQRARAEL